MGDFDDKERLDDAYRKRVTNTKTGGSFAILRTAKITSMGNMSGSLQHTFRERETLNADSEKIRDNQVLIGPDNSKEILQSWHDRAPDKIRKNAVRGIEYLVTGSPEAMAKMSREQQDAYFAKSVEWLKEKHGEENILSAVVHRDETTPHLSAMIIPIDDRGKLNAREFLGGREKLSQMQTDFAERVGREQGLERGVQGTKSKHKTIKSYYADLEQLPKHLERLPERTKSGFMGRGGETDEEYDWRASVALKTALDSQRGHYLREIKSIETEQSQALALASGYKNLAERTEETVGERVKEQKEASNSQIQRLEKANKGLKIAVQELPWIADGLTYLEHNRNREDKSELTQKMFEALNRVKQSVNLSESIEKGITDRLRGLGWKEPVRAKFEPTPEQRKQAKETAEEKYKAMQQEKERPAPPKDRDTGRER